MQDSLERAGLQKHNDESPVFIASFPGLSHLQYLIAYSMQIQRGEAWEIWSRAVTIAHMFT